MKQGLIILGVLALMLVWVWSSYNKLIPQDENVKEKWAKVQNQYQRRMDLIPNLVNTVKGAADFEKETLTAVIEARAKATQTVVDPNNISAEKLKEFQAAQGQLSQAMGRLMVVAEQYPNLKANQNFLDLQTQLEGTENRISAARNDYNESVKEFNIGVRKFPVNMIAGMFGLSIKPTFEADAAAQKAPTVQF
jgi:LemA protein